MLSLVLGHVDEFCRLLNDPKSGFADGLWWTDKRNHRSVGRSAGIHIQKLNPWDGFDHASHCLNHIIPPAFGDVGHTFYESLHHDRENRPCRSLVNAASSGR